jgi:hypothetical protein
VVVGVAVTAAPQRWIGLGTCQPDVVDMIGSCSVPAEKATPEGAAEAGCTGLTPFLLAAAAEIPPGSA